MKALLYERDEVWVKSAKKYLKDKEEGMVQRWKMSPNQSMVTEPDGGYVEYTDHLAAMSELKDQGQTIVDRYEERLKEKDREIERLKETTIDVWIKVPKEDSDAG